MVCRVCETNLGLIPHICTRCGHKHCVDHRLPEKHMCNGVGFNHGKSTQEYTQQTTVVFEEHFLPHGTDKTIIIPVELHVSFKR